jgi:hypothetical protein
MMWLKDKEPGPKPAPPKHIDLGRLLAQLAAADLAGDPKTPMMAYIEAHLPQRAVDRWGNPLPLSIVEQEKLDRMCAVLFDVTRAQKLLHSGRIDTIEAEALANGQPGMYSELVRQANGDMVRAKPPFAPWAERSLSVLFGRDAALAYGDLVAEEKPKERQFEGKPPPPSPADLSAEPALKGR